jgi:hypothetical protein
MSFIGLNGEFPFDGIFVVLKIYQQSINTGQIPEDWKNANIVPIFKKADRSKPSNYRPVSLTSVASKILEHIIVRGRLLYTGLICLILFLHLFR